MAVGGVNAVGEGEGLYGGLSGKAVFIVETGTTENEVEPTRMKGENDQAYKLCWREEERRER